MAKHWDALVLNDYEAVMPLTWNKKYGIYYLYQPFLTAQLGVFGTSINAATAGSISASYSFQFRYWDFYLNHQNTFPLNNFRLYQRKNLVLDLNKPYEEIFNNYRENIQRNIRKAEQLGCKAVKDFEVEKVIELATQQMKTYTKESTDNVKRFTELYHQLYDRQQASSYGIFSAKNELIASCFSSFLTTGLIIFW